MDVLDKNKTLDLVELTTRKKTTSGQQVFKRKLSAKGKVENYKAHLAAKGYYQANGIYFGEIFSLVAKLFFIRFALSIDVFHLEVEKIVEKKTLLHDDLKKIFTIYIKQPNV